MRKSLWIIPLVLLLVGAGTARADIVTFDVSASLIPGTTGASCSPSPCMLSGTLTLDNSTGSISAADINLIGATPAVGPFTNVTIPSYFPSIGVIGEISNSSIGTVSVFLKLFPDNTAWPTGYTGGSLIEAAVENTSASLIWFCNPGLPACTTPVGTLTVVTPEPSPVSLMLLGIGLVLVMRKRSAHGLP